MSTNSIDTTVESVILTTQQEVSKNCTPINYAGADAPKFYVHNDAIKDLMGKVIRTDRDGGIAFMNDACKDPVKFIGATLGADATCVKRAISGSDCYIAIPQRLAQQTYSKRMKAVANE